MIGDVAAGGRAATLAVVSGLFLALLAAAPAEAQTELMSLLDPRFGEQMPRADYRLTWYPEKPVEGQPTELELIQHNFTFFAPVVKGQTDEFSVSGRVRLQDYETRAVLPETGVRFPSELWDVQLGVTYRHLFENRWIAGGSVTVGSASDKPFETEDELYARVFGFLRVPHRERHAWLFSLIYASDSSELGGIPVPGIAYIYAPSEQFNAVIGVPFSSVEYKPVEQVILEAQYYPLRRVRARATYRPFRPFRVYLGFDWDNEFHYLRDRGDKDDKFIYYEKRWTAGARFDLRHVGIDVAGGWLFDRFYFEGERYRDRRENRIDVDDGPFVAARVSVRF